jgi:hypothetical protein
MKNVMVILVLLSSLVSAAQSNETKRLDSLTKAYAANGYHGVVRVAKGDQLTL